MAIMARDACCARASRPVVVVVDVVDCGICSDLERAGGGLFVVLPGWF